MKTRDEASIRSVLRAEREILLAFLFGSFAGGRPGKSSDVDIALVLNRLPAAKARLALRLGLAGALSDIFGREVDIAFMNSAGSILKYQVARKGKLLFERRRGLAKQFKLNALKEYFDYLPTFQFHYERMRARRTGDGRRRAG